MKADTLTLRDIFQKETRYVVPTFQRPYVWNEEEHWQLLWDDLHQVVEEFLAEMGEAGAGRETDVARADHRDVARHRL